MGGGLVGVGSGWVVKNDGWMVENEELMGKIGGGVLPARGGL